MTVTSAIGRDYSDERLRVLVEEFITQQRSIFTLKGGCDYVLYWAMEDAYNTGTGLYESAQLSHYDCERVNKVLGKIVKEGRIVVECDHFHKFLN